MKSDKRLDELDDQAFFQEWIAAMDDSLDIFSTMVPREVSRQLDFTPKSLDALERWVLDRYPSIEATRAESEQYDLEYMARYVGETIRRNIGGEWRISYDDPKAAYYAVPHIRFAEQVPPLTPKYMLTASTSRRTGHFLRTVLTNTGEMIEEKRGK